MVARNAAGPGLAGILLRDLAYLRGQAPYEVARGIAPLNPVVVAGILGMLVPGLRRSRAFVAVTVATLGSLALWVASTADPRYVLPALGVMAMGGGLLCDHVFTWVALCLPDRLGWVTGERMRLIMVPIIAGLLLWSPLADLDQTFGRHLPPTASVARRAYQVARLPCYSGIDYLNGHLGSGYTAYGLGCEQSRYFAQGRCIGDWFSTGSYPRVLGGLDIEGVQGPGATGQLAQRLRELGARYLLVPGTSLRDPVSLTRTGDFGLVFAGEGTYVFQVSS